MDTPPALVSVAEGKLYFFKNWPNAEVPPVCAGIYTIWRDHELLYVGMAGRALNEAQIIAARGTGSKGKGLASRLSSHAAGRRSGNQFCLYVGDRLVLPGLTPEEIKRIGNGTLNLDKLVRAYVRNYLSYRFAETKDSATAMALEKAIRRGCLAAGKPLLNPA
jgi:hypothetical protein